MGENILVTGFGPFGDHPVNASWETVKLLPDKINGCTVRKEELEVSYEFVQSAIPQLWEKYKPKLVVHVGVSSIAEKITIETCANRKGYVKRDCLGSCHPTGKVCSSKEGENCIFGAIKYNEICDYINKHECDAEAVISTDAGRYLCEYTFYNSLKIDKSKTMFVHVPCINKPYTVEQMTEALLEIIKYAIEH